MALVRDNSKEVAKLFDELLRQRNEWIARAEAAEAEVARLREVLEEMAERYGRGDGRFGGFGIKMEILALLDTGA